ncbi:protein of unknown function [Lactiplantibacillus plantarum]
MIFAMMIGSEQLTDELRRGILIEYLFLFYAMLVSLNYYRTGIHSIGRLF